MTFSIPCADFRIGSYSNPTSATSGRVYHRGGAPQVTPLVM